MLMLSVIILYYDDHVNLQSNFAEANPTDNVSRINCINVPMITSKLY